MAPTKARALNEDSRADNQSTRDRQIAAAAHARKSKGGNPASKNGTALKELAMATTEAGEVNTPSQAAGINWNEVPREILETYRVAYNLSCPPSFASARQQALLTSPLGLRSPTMARRKEKQLVSKETLAMAVRKHFNSMAVGETDVVVDTLYKIKHQDKAFRMRSAPVVAKKPQEGKP